jgi:hypothetical protein
MRVMPAVNIIIMPVAESVPEAATVVVVMAAGIPGGCPAGSTALKKLLLLKLVFLLNLCNPKQNKTWLWLICLCQWSHLLGNVEQNELLKYPLWKQVTHQHVEH